MLPFTLHGYQTSVCTSTGATPFSLVYVMEVVLPFEVEVPSLRILAESGLEESKWARNRFNQLNLIEGKRLAAMSYGRLYQSRVKNAFDKKVCPCKFNEGDLVLTKVSQAQKDHRGKWAPNYEGAFVVKKAFSGGALFACQHKWWRISFAREFQYRQMILCIVPGAARSFNTCLFSKDSLGFPKF